MTWIFVVAGIVALAIAVHFYEKKQERERKARWQASLHQGRRELHLVSHTREIREAWQADFRTMKLSVSRVEGAEKSAEPISYELERDAAGVWLMRPLPGPDTEPTEQVPPSVAQHLEAQYQRFLSG